MLLLIYHMRWQAADGLMQQWWYGRLERYARLDMQQQMYCQPLQDSPRAAGQ
jgi:hypothetical protein